MKKRLLPPTLDNLLNLFSRRLNSFKGESRRSYRKAYSSFQLFVIEKYELSSYFHINILENWVVSNLLQGLKINTVSFYLDKISSLYSGVAHLFEGGKTSVCKDMKTKLKSIDLNPDYYQTIKKASDDFKERWKISHEKLQEGSFIWACLALNSGINADVVKGMIENIPSELSFLNLCETRNISDSEREDALISVRKSLAGEESKWFAMRLRPKVKFDDIIRRFSIISSEVKMPEFFYPYEELAKKIGRKVIWQGKPVIRDVVFFKKRKSEIFYMFTHLYDLAWCYRNPGVTPGNYASIPEKAMDDFKKSLGMLTPDFELAPAGEMELRPGDEVIIVNGEYIDQRAEIIKKPSLDEDGNKVYRVTLLNSNGHWDIGIDARLLKKA